MQWRLRRFQGIESSWLATEARLAIGGPDERGSAGGKRVRRSIVALWSEMPKRRIEDLLR